MKKSIHYSFIAVIFVITANVSLVSASQSNGTILDSNKITKICHDTACSSYGQINWRPTLNSNTNGATIVNITDTAITGWLWGNEIGWVNMQPTGGGVAVNPNTGAISGYAYASVGSWINFSPTSVSGGTNVGVVIDTSGKFTGWAYVSGLNGGWIKFDCSDLSACIETDWRPVSHRTNTSTNTSNTNQSYSSSGSSVLIFPNINVYTGSSTTENISGRSNLINPDILNQSLVNNNGLADSGIIENDINNNQSGYLDAKSTTQNRVKGDNQASTTVMRTMNDNIFTSLTTSPVAVTTGAVALIILIIMLIRFLVI